MTAPLAAASAAADTTTAARSRRPIVACVIALCAVLAAALVTSASASAAPIAASDSPAATAPTGTLRATTPSVAQGANATFAYTATPAVAKNWVAIFPHGTVPDHNKWIVYQYAPAASGTVALSTSKLTPGTWDTYLLYDDGFTQLAGPITLTVTAGPGTPTGTLHVAAGTQDTVEQGVNINFDYTASPVNAKNWVALYAPSTTPAPGQYKTWIYVPNGSGTASLRTAGLAPGPYVAFLLYDDGYTVMAGPVSFTVTAPPPPKPLTPRTYTKRISGSGTGALSDPFGVAVDSAGGVWVADSDHNRVERFSATGTLVTAFGDTGDALTQLTDPTAVALDGRGHVFVADTGNNRVVEYTTSGQQVATIGAAGTGAAQFDQPEGIAADAAHDLLYVADTNNGRVQKFALSTGTYVGALHDGLDSPQGLALDPAGDLWIANNGIYDDNTEAIVEYSPGGAQLRSFGQAGATLGGISNPAAVAVDDAGHVYVSEPDFQMVEVFTTAGQYLAEIGTPADGKAGTLSLPQGLAIDAAGRLFVADSGNDRVAVYTPSVAPTITNQPADVTVRPGGVAVFRAAATGTPTPTIQWQQRKTAASSWTDLRGATRPKLTLLDAAHRDSGYQYRAVFTNVAGSVTTDAAVLIVR